MNQPMPPTTILNKTAETWVEVQSSARLHMGFFDLHGGLGRQFGSIGLSIDAPQLALRVSKSDQVRVSLSGIKTISNGDDELTDRALQQALRKRIEEILLVLDCPQPIAVDIQSLIPSHAGLGSGTQFALSIGTALNHLFDLGYDLTTIGQKTGRGNRSGIGIGTFAQGGLIIDAGRLTSAPKVLPPILARYAFPKAWCVLLIQDSAQAGIHGEEELHAFRTLPRFSEEVAAHLCRHVLMQTMPAMMAEDLVTFGASIHALQTHVGDYFAPAQGGRYANPAVGAVLSYLIENAAPCVGQSSWGPTGFAVFENAATAQQYLDAITSTLLAHQETTLTFALCHANNNGAIVRCG